MSACATTKPMVINANEFETTNYQANIDQLVLNTDALKDFDSETKQEAKINVEDLSTLMQADVYFNQADYSNALPIYETLANKYKIPLIIYKTILCYERLGVSKTQINQVNNLIKLFIQEAPNTKIANILEVKINLYNGNLKQAQTNLDKILTVADIEHKRQILLFLSSTLTLEETSRVNQHVLNKFAQYTVDKYANIPEAYLLASVCYSITNNSKELKDNLAYINKTYHSWQIPLFWGASILSNNNNYTTIIKVVKPMVNDVTITEPSIQNIYIAALLNSDQEDTAKLYLLNQLKLEKTNNSLLNLGLIYAREKNYNEALKYLTQVNTDNPTINNMIKMLVGLIYDTQSDYINATAYYSKISGNLYLENVANILAVYDYNELHDNIKLESTLSQIITDKNLSGVDAILFKAKYYISLSDYNTAYTILQSSYKQYSSNIDYLYAYASAAALSNHMREAISLYKIYIKKAPKLAYGYNDLAYIYAENTHDYRLALKYATKAATISINDESILDTIGYIYYKKGDYLTAYAYISSSYQMGQSPDVAKHLKEVLIKLNKPELASQIIVVDKNKLNQDLKALLLDKMLNLLMLLQYGVLIK